MIFETGLCCSGIVIGLVLLAAFYLFTVYNGLIELRNNIDRAWANIDVLLKQRTDLIPNLVEAVKGYMKYEKNVLADITMLRSSMLSAQGPAAKAAASDALSAGLKTIFAVSENYPELKASENFLELQKQLSGIENQIADRREFYNNSVLLYNTRIHSVPDTIIAGMLSFKDKEYFKAGDDEKAPVEVKFDDAGAAPEEKQAPAQAPPKKSEGNGGGNGKKGKKG